MDNKHNESNEKSKLKSKLKSVKKKLAKNNQEKYDNVESRLTKSTNEWVAKKLNDAKLVATTASTSNLSANSFPSKPFAKSFSTDRLLSCSTPYSKTTDDMSKSNLSKTNEKLSESTTTTLNKSRSRRKSIFNFNLSDNKDQQSSSSVCGTDAEAKNKELEELIIRSRYLQSNFMSFDVRLMSAKLDEQSMTEISGIWEQNNKLREQLIESKSETKYINLKIDAINAFKYLREFLSKYIEVREHIDPLYNSFAQLINQQKLLFKLESKEEQSIAEMEKCAKNLSEMKAQLTLFDSLYAVSADLKNVAHIKNVVNSIKQKFAESVDQFEKMLAKKINYQKTKEEFKIESVDSSANTIV